jgi:hypothetical protein
MLPRIALMRQHRIYNPSRIARTLGTRTHTRRRQHTQHHNRPSPKRHQNLIPAFVSKNVASTASQQNMPN